MSKFPMTPVDHYVTLYDEPALMIAMRGIKVDLDSVNDYASQFGLYDKNRRNPREGHWYSVNEAGENKQSLKRGDLVVADLFSRDHIIKLGDDKFCQMASANIIGVLSMGTETTPMSFQTVGHWLTVENDDDVSARLVGLSKIIAPDSALELGQLSGDHQIDIPGEAKIAGARVKFARVVDAGPAAKAEPGDVAVYQAVAGSVEFSLCGRELSALVGGCVLGFIKADKFPKWIPAEPRQVDLTSKG